jgi:hypothetical protein
MKKLNFLLILTLIIGFSFLNASKSQAEGFETATFAGAVFGA